MKVFFISSLPDACWYRDACPDIENTRQVSFDIKFTRQHFEKACTSFVDLLCFCSVLCLLCFVRVCLYVLCGHLLGKGWPLGSRLWCLLWVCHFPIGILGQVWYLIVSIPDLCTLTYFVVIARLAEICWILGECFFYIKFTRPGFENAFWYPEACTDIENTRWVSFGIKFTRQGFENAFDIAARLA